MTDRKAIDEFLAHRRLAIVGVSRNARDFSRSVYREFEKQGVDECVSAHVDHIWMRRGAGGPGAR